MHYSCYFDYFFCYRHRDGAVLRKLGGEQGRQAASRRGAKTSFVNKCKRDACERKAVSKEGKSLHGAAKNSFMAKCKKAA